jgi:hypothetical protein
MKKFIVIFSLVAISSVASASEQYQMTNAVGIWKATFNSGALIYFDLVITSSEDGKSLKVEHCTLDVEFSGKCTPYDNIVGVGTYSQSDDSIQITESNGSPTPTYNITVNTNDTGILNRTWGTQIIKYFKIE